MHLVTAIGLGLALQFIPATVMAACDPGTDPDRSDIANARAAVAANCDCATATSHGAYVTCAAGQANAVLTNKTCASAVKKCAAKSTCGRPGFVTCCRTNRHGKIMCSVKKEAARCTNPPGGNSCVGSLSSCCDACVTGGCATTTTTTLPSSACASGSFPECGGSCPPGSLCGPDEGLTGCRCIASTEPCGGTSPFCNGTCPSGQECATFQNFPLNTCGCIPTGNPPCGNPGVPLCGGACPAGLECHPTFEPPIAGNVVICQCTNPGPCGQGGAECPNGTACAPIPGGPLCGPISCTPDNPYPTCGGQCGAGGECQPFSVSEFNSCVCAAP